MAVDYNKIGGGLPVDPRFIEKIQGSPEMRADQGSSFMSDYGGPSTYITMSGLAPTERLVYSAVLQGESVPEEIASITALDIKRVNSDLANLTKMGLVKSQEVVNSD